MTVVASGYERKALDLYETPAWVTEALLRHLPVTGKRVWEPAAGNHMMADALRAAGAEVWTSDIKTYDRPHDQELDFPAPRVVGSEPDHFAVITNPPYGKQNRDAVRFAEMALRGRGWVALLLPAKFDFGKTRTHLFRDNPRFWGKIALLDRIQWFEGAHGSTEDHAWFIWAPVQWWGHPRLLWEAKTP